MRLSRQLELDKFDWFCLLLLVPITVLAITPSSYGIVLSMFGHGGEGLLWGSPRPIRSDEWSVWTPYMQMAVLNDFGRFNELSTYHQDLRGFNALPLWDWALVFKPLMWPFWLLEPARAFALHHGLIIVSFLIGWKKLFLFSFESAQQPKSKSLFLAILASLLLFFTGFVQYWWTTLGPILALTPWLLLWIIKWRSSLGYYFGLGYIAVVWLLSHTYPPIIVSMAYFGVMLLAIHQPRFLVENKVKLLCIGLSCLGAVVVTYFYYSDIIPVMQSTVYPGKRVAVGGESPWLLWLSSIIPFIAHSNHQDLLGLNICEVGVVSSLLPFLTLSFVKPNWNSAYFKKVLVSSVCLFSFFSAWMLLPLPSFFGKVTLLSLVPGNRLLFALGLIVTYVCLVMILTGTWVLSAKRCVIFSVLVIFGYFVPSFAGVIHYGEKSAWELFSLAIIVLVFAFNRVKAAWLTNGNSVMVLPIVALLVNTVYFAHFNPAQSAFAIFELHEQPEVQAINAQKENRQPHWVVEQGYSGAILSGVGLNSFTSVLIQPQLSLFREMYPEMDSVAFNNLFNRYAHIWLSDTITQPYSPQADVVVIPLADVKESFDMPEESSSYKRDLAPKDQVLHGGHIDLIKLEGNKLFLSGWGLAKPVLLTGAFELDDIEQISTQTRLDVAKTFNNRRLERSGFVLVVKNIARYHDILESEGLCLYTEDEEFGVRQLEVSKDFDKYMCKK
ncbi:DUF7657 domain-containing protein [Vibrio rotiferianus]|uniref:DUF7657 domain-containing protein n=1 Tax=Vibrio rotiferianus TaxID=190895 RepID=UPI003F518A69